MRIITVKTSREYNVYLGAGVIQNLATLIEPLCKGHKLGIITDDTVDELYARDVEKDLQVKGYSVSKFVFPHGEGAKNLSTLSDILEYFATCHFTRKDFFISIGGGVVGDTTGLAAAMYMRGIQFIQVPTTLLSMVDASVGGKTAVDLKAGKNLVGAFWQPSMVVADTEIIAKLSEDIFAEGMAEVIKSDLIANAGIVKWTILGEVKSHLEEIIESCIRMKQSVVEQDEYETKGLRKVLNMGHTVAHAIEKLSGYEVSHGVAVGTGLVWEAKMALTLGLCDVSLAREIRQAVDFYGLYYDVPYAVKDMVEAMRSDKKNEDQRIDFVFPVSYGKWEERKLERGEVIEIIRGLDE
jgi:3-dehydroquinate synthase